MPLPEILQQLDRLDKNSPQFQDLLTSFLYKEGFEDCIPKLQDEDVVWLVKYLDQVLDSLDPSDPAFRKCLRELGRTCGTREKLPPSYILESSLSIPSTHPIASGSSGDVYEGLLSDSRVCVKRLRIYAKEELRAVKKTLYREVVTWRRLTHPNIVPLLGITLEPLQLISAWILGRELKEYIVDNPDTDRLALVSGIADGLNYLHSRDVVHGDLKGPNILVDDTGCPRISDFGLAMVTRDHDPLQSAQHEPVHITRWTAPEILNEQGTYSKEADVFSFAMVTVEVFTGEIPFHNLLTPAAILAILDEKRPARPTHPNLTNKLWELVERCWDQDPRLRPEMSEVLKTLRNSDLSDGVFERASELSDVESDFFLDGTVSRVPELSDTETDEYPEPPKPIILSKNPGIETSPPISRGDSTGQDEAGNTDKRERQLSRRSLDKNNASRGDVGDPHADDDDSRAPLPTLPQAPTNCFFREEIVDEVLDLTEQVASVALFGPIGVGKSFVSLTLLHHNQTQARFGKNRHFMRCDNLSNSLEAFLERLSDAIHTDRTTDVAQLRSHVEASPPFILVLDGVDFILDPLVSGAEDILSAIEEFGSYEHVCLVTTSRIYPDIHGFHRIKVPILSKDGAQDAFYSLCNVSRSSAVNDLIAKLDFHPLAINLLADSARENEWDGSTLLKAWDEDQTGTLEKKYHQTLKDAVEQVFRSPTIQKLGTTARNTLAAIAVFPGGVEELRLERSFPGIVRIEEAVDVLCKFSLIYRQDGFVRMLSPFRFYFAMSPTPAGCVEVIRWDADCNPAEALSPIYTRGRRAGGPPHTSLRRETRLREKWAKRFRLLKRRLLAFFGPPAVPTIIISNPEGEPADPPPAVPVQQMSSAPVAYTVD